MAIEVLETPQGIHATGGDAGMFNLPPEFDQKQFVAEWCEEGMVEMKKQRQVLPQTQYTADGWQVWMKEGSKKLTIVHASGNKKFVLMFRPRKIQEQVNAILGNVSKNLLKREIAGETLTTVKPDGSVAHVQDPGMLTEQMLKSEIGGMSENPGGDVTPNKVEIEPSAAANVTAAEQT